MMRLVTRSVAKPGAKSIAIRTGLILPWPGCSTAGVMRLASGTRSVSAAQPVPASDVGWSGLAETCAIGPPGM
jgi:hypothetical protein